MTRLARLLAILERHHGAPTPPALDGPFEMVLWEIVAYLVDDDRRAAAFQALRTRVGLTPRKILAAPLHLLREITRLGGPIAADDRAGRLREAARIAIEECGGDVATVLHLPHRKAIKQLKRFPMIGEPGAAKILLFCGASAHLALESNGMRVLVRIGIGEERKSYAATYKSVVDAAIEQLPEDAAILTSAHRLLRKHGQDLCFRNGPACHSCPVNSDCRSSSLRPAL